jgi:WD40 repeat protein
VASGRRSAPLPPRPHWLTCAVFSPGGQTLASSNRFEIMLTDLVGGGSRSIDTGNSEVLSLVYSPDGSHLTSGHGEGLIKTWEVATGRQTQSLPGHSSYVFGLALSPDGRTLASAGGDRTVRVWDTDTGQELLCLTDCKARVNSVAFSPDGSILAAADHTGAITLWRARPQD